MDAFELLRLKNGAMSLRDCHTGETFHPGIGPLQEASILHVKQQRLGAKAQAGGPLCIWDVGLGAGANALASITEILAHLNEHSEIELHSFDRDLSALTFALQNAESLAYVLGYEPVLRELLEQRHVQLAPRFKWSLHLGDFCQIVNAQLSHPDAILYDPYSPAKNPQMWSLDHFSRLYQALDPNRPCLWTNYTRSTLIRTTLLLAGFYVGVGCSIHEKEETTIASNDLSLLERPLGLDWLENRVRVSHAAAPLRAGQYLIAPLTDEDLKQLRLHPQFNRR